MKRHQYPYEAQQEINDLERKLQEAREEFSNLVDNMGYFTQRDLMNSIKKVMIKLTEKGDE